MGEWCIFMGEGLHKPMGSVDTNRDKTTQRDMEALEHLSLQYLLQELLEKLATAGKTWQKVGVEQVLRGNAYQSRHPVCSVN